MRNSDYLNQQHGIVTSVTDIPVEAGTKSGVYTVTAYSKTGFTRNLLYNLSNAIIYRAIDSTIFKPIERAVRKLLPDAPLQELAYAEYKIVTRATRAFFRNGSRLPLEFDMTDEESVHVTEAGGKPRKPKGGNGGGHAPQGGGGHGGGGHLQYPTSLTERKNRQYSLYDDSDAFAQAA